MKKKIVTVIVLMVFMIFIPLSTVSAAIVNPNQIYTYEQMEKDIISLAKEYPELISYETIGKTEYGRNIYAVSLGNGLSTSYINASNHAREWITTNLVMKMIDEYAYLYSKSEKVDQYNVKRIFDDHTIWFVPMMNPDGVTLQQSGLSAFPKETHSEIIKMNGGSKDFKRWKANGKGVDLNRQFDAGWEIIRNSSSVPSFANYKGTAPHLASEVKAVIDFTHRIKPEMAVSYHSSGSIIFWHYLQEGDQYKQDLVHAQKISELTGYRLASQHGKYAGGGYTDWFSETFKKPAFTPELGTYVGPTNVPLSQFERIWKENRLVGLYVAQESHKIYEEEVLKGIRPVRLILNEQLFLEDVESAVLLNGTTMVPVRTVFEELGAVVNWDENARIIEVKKDNIHITLHLNSKKAYVNDEELLLPVPPQLIESRTLIPIRFVSEAIGAKVSWDPYGIVTVITRSL